ncbi:MAG: c-type cytochrome [Burkholderiales bacterium]|nr:c-type cytochrome [Burkholderiales bacterium]
MRSSELHAQARRVAGIGLAALAATVLAAAPAAAQSTAGNRTGQAVATAVCAACHGEDGNSAVPMFPKIAGLQESYLVKQLRDFKSGRRKSDVMAPVVADLKPEDMQPLAAYYSHLSLKPEVPGERRTTDLGKLIYFDGNEETGVPACVGCHQPAGAGHLLYPRIGGQHAVYVKQQLKNFASGERTNDANRFMRVVAQRMSDEEMDAVAAYLAGLGR